MSGIILFNPKSAVAKHRIPNAIMNIAASVNGMYNWVIVDGNREVDPYQKIKEYLDTGKFKYLGFTVMPGPQTKQAIPFSKKLKENYTLDALIISPKTPDAVTSAPAPAPFITKGCSTYLSV